MDETYPKRCANAEDKRNDYERSFGIKSNGHRDWMMKIIPQKYREKMEEWFGKKEISGHVNSLFLTNSEKKLVKATYLTFIDKCSQDMAASSCVFKNNLEQFHTDFPDVDFIHYRNDNARCYSDASAILAKKGNL